MGNDAATIKLQGDNAGLQKALSASEGMVTRWAGSVGGALGAISGFLIIQKVVEWGKYFVGEATEAEDALHDLQLTLNNVGDAAGQSEEDLVGMAQAIENTTKFTAEAAMSVEKFFLTTKKIKGDIFKDGIKASADLAAFMKTDLSQAGSFLSKALASPERGMMMLRRAGILFTESEKETIKSMVEAGNAAEAQRMILDKLNSTVGGAGAASLETFSGAAAHFQTKMGDVAEEIGTALIPILSFLMPLVERGAKIFIAFLKPITSLIAYIGELAIGFMDWLVPMEELDAGITQLEEYIGTFSDTVMAYLGPAIEFASMILRDLSVAIWETGKTIVEAMMPYVVSIIETLTEWGEVIWSYLKPAIIWIAEAGITAFTGLQTVIQNFADVAMIAIESFALGAVKAFNILVHFITEVIPAYLDWFGKNWREVFTDMYEFVKTVLGNIGTNLQNFFSAVSGWFKGEGFNFEWTSLTDGFKKTMDELPQIAERKKGDIEKALEADIGNRSVRVSEAFTANLDKNKKYLEGLAKEAKAKRETLGPADKPTGEKGGKGDVAAEDEADVKKKKEKEGTSKQGTIEDLTSLSKRITEAAASATKEDKAVKATLEAAKMNKDALDKQNGLIEDQNETLEGIAESNKKMADGVVVGAMEDD